MTRGTLIFLGICVLANLVRNACFIQPYRGIPLPYFIVSEPTLSLLSALDLFAAGLTLQLASFFKNARRNGEFRDLRMAGVGWRRILAPIRNIAIALILLDGVIEITIYALFGTGAIRPRYYGAAFSLFISLASSWFVASSLVLLNAMRLARAFQIIVLFGFGLALGSGQTWTADALTVRLFPHAERLMSNTILQEIVGEKHSTYMFSQQLGAYLYYVGVVIVLALLSPLGFWLATRVADRRLVAE